MRTIVDRAVEAASEAVVLSDLAESFVPLVEEALGGTGALLFEFGDDGKPCGVSGDLAPHLAGYNASVFGEDPLQRALRRADPVALSTVLLEDVLSYDELRSSRAFHDFYRPLRVERIIGAWPTRLRYGAPGMVGLIVGRPLAERPFGARERRIFERVLPALRAVVVRHRRTLARDRERDAARLRHDHVLATARQLGLTRAEADVLACVARGLDNRSIAAELLVSEATVKTHLRQILDKLGVDSRTQAALRVHGVLPRSHLPATRTR